MANINVINKVNHPVGVVVPQLNLRRDWMGKEQKIAIDENLLKELMFDPGFHNMVMQGILYIEEMDVKKELGIEPFDAEEPVNVIVLTDAEREKYLTVYTLKNFKDKVSKLNQTQLNELADYAISKKIVDVEKCKVIKQLCGRDILQAIRLGEQDKED